jgi:hypothetical protein
MQRIIGRLQRVDWSAANRRAIVRGGTMTKQQPAG